LKEDQMIHEARPTTPHDDVGRTRCLRRTGRIVSALLAVVLLATACAGGSNGPGVAGQGSSSTPAASPSGGDPMDAALAYARCMREHGISDFPDPQPGGGPIQAGSNWNSPQFNAADDACKSLLPVPSAEEQQQRFEDMLQFAQCMREHGIADFPDPKPGEGIDIDAGIDAGAHPDLDPNNPQFQAANEACGGLFPDKPNTNTQSNRGTR
jgi:hypothetical protein